MPVAGSEGRTLGVGVSGSVTSAAGATRAAATDTFSSDVCRLFGVSPPPDAPVPRPAGVRAAAARARAQVCRLIGHAGIVTASGGAATRFRPARRFCAPRRAGERRGWRGGSPDAAAARLLTSRCAPLEVVSDRLEQDVGACSAGGCAMAGGLILDQQKAAPVVITHARWSTSKLFWLANSVT